MTKHSRTNEPSLVGQRDSELPHPHTWEAAPDSVPEPRERPALEDDLPEPEEAQATQEASEEDAHDEATHLEEEHAVLEIAPDERGEPDPRRDD